ncbi:MAG TPA: hypothetical protein VMY42_17325 [Thermoguttaceae bacterium]|nr:hypothetical protein [Thermoguttaceae bacterium]
MVRIVGRAIFLWILLVLPARADTLTGKVVSIADGDTLTVLVGQV